MAAALLGPSCASVALEAGLGVSGGLLLCSATASDSRRVPSSLAALIAATAYKATAIAAAALIAPLAAAAPTASARLEAGRNSRWCCHAP